MKYFAIGLLLLSIVSCSPFGINTAGYSVKDEALYVAWARTSSYKYIAEENGGQCWKSPKQFEADGGGDCEDFVGHMLYYLGEGEAVLVTWPDGDKVTCHCVVKYRNEYIEPQIYDRHLNPEAFGWKIIKTYSWSEYMSKITDFGTRDL